MKHAPSHFRFRKPSFRSKIAMVVVFLAIATISKAQDGNAGINEATSLVKGYFNTGINLLYAIGAVVGLVGAIRVYNAWSHGDPQTNKLASAWFGACIFLVVVATVLKSFYGL